MEHERKFLLRGDGWRAAVRRREQLTQGYLSGGGSGERCSVRVRVSGSRASLNIKEARLGVSRQEYEYPLAPEDARCLLELCAGVLVEKTRHYLVHAGNTWEIDEFAGANRGLVVAEIELSRPDETFEAPPWLGAEVSLEQRYYNSCLARRPYRDW